MAIHPGSYPGVEEHSPRAAIMKAKDVDAETAEMILSRAMSVVDSLIDEGDFIAAENAWLDITGLDYESLEFVGLGDALGENTHM